MILYKYIPTDTRVLREIKTLKKRGINVTIFDTREPSEKNFGKLPDNSPYTRYPLLKISESKRQSFMGLSLFWLVTFLNIFHLLRRKNIDVIHCHDLTGLPPGALIRFFFPRIKLIYDSHELFPEAAYDKLGYFPWLIFFIIEKTCIRYVDYVIGASSNQIAILKERYPEKPFECLLNVPDIKNITTDKIKMNKNFSKLDGIKRIVYSGGVLKYRGYDKFIEVVAHFVDEPEKVKFIIAGDGPYLKELQSRIEKKKLNAMIEQTGQLDYNRLLETIAQSDIGICLYENTRNNHIMISNKIFEYMLCKIPFIFSNLKSSQPILREIGAIMVNPDAPAQHISAKIRNLMNDPVKREIIATRGWELINKKYNWSVESKKLIKVYTRVFTVASSKESIQNTNVN